MRNYIVVINEKDVMVTANVGYEPNDNTTGFRGGHYVDIVEFNCQDITDFAKEIGIVEQILTSFENE